jgi:hypothetical protein
MKALGNIARIQVTNEHLMMLLSLYESKGKSHYHDDLFQRDVQAFDRKALEADVKAVAKRLDGDMTDARIRLFSKRDPVPRNNTEILLGNIKSALVLLRRRPQDFELVPNEIADLAKVLSKDLEPIRFRTIQVTDENAGIMPKKTRSSREDLDELMTLFHKLKRSGQYELTQLITNFYVDVLNMDIMDRDNTLISDIILYALLFKYFPVFRYVPFFPVFNAEKTAWEHAVVSARYYWAEGFAQTDMLSRIIVGLLNRSYETVARMAHEYAFEKDLNKSDNIENTVMKLDELFTKEDIRKRHPNVSDATIDRTLKRLKDEDKIRPIGRGRSAKWQRTIPGSGKIGARQMSLFDE